MSIRTLFAALLLSAAPLCAAAQEGVALCYDGEFVNSGGPPGDLERYTPLMELGGLRFLYRVDNTAMYPRAHLVVQNQNPFPTEIRYDATLHGSRATPGVVDTMSFPRRCALLRAGEYTRLSDQNTVFTYRAGTLFSVQVSDVAVRRVAPQSQNEPMVAEGATPQRAGAIPSIPQYQCAAGEGSAAQRLACELGFRAAAARSAVLRDEFSGITRECLLSYAELQEGVAGRVRAGQIQGDTLRSLVPRCYPEQGALWNAAAVSSVCPEGRWSAANAGVSRCAELAEAARMNFEPPAGGAGPREPLAAERVGPQEEARLRSAIDLNPEVASFHASLGDALRDQDRMDEAIAAYREAVRLNPREASYRAALATALLSRGDIRGAEEHFRQAVRLEPDSPQYRLGLGDVYLQRGQLSRARAEYARAAQLDPEGPEPVLALAELEGMSPGASTPGGPARIWPRLDTGSPMAFLVSLLRWFAASVLLVAGIALVLPGIAVLYLLLVLFPAALLRRRSARTQKESA